MTDEIFSRICDIIVQKKGVDPSLISIDSSFQDLGMDSLDAVELVSDLEEVFDVTIPNTELQHFKTLRQAVEGLQRAMAG